MDKLEYAQTVIDQVHSRTFRGALKWETDRRWIMARPTPSIYITINFDDDGPDSAVWEDAMIKHPVGGGIIILGNPDSPKARHSLLLAQAQTLEQLNDIFRDILLEPRAKEFDTAMKKLSGT